MTNGSFLKLLAKISPHISPKPKSSSCILNSAEKKLAIDFVSVPVAISEFHATFKFL